MSKTNSARVQSVDSTAEVPPLQRRPILFRVLLATYLIWMAILLIMYFTTVRKSSSPAGDQAVPPTQSVPVLPGG